MIIRRLEDMVGTERDVPAPTWRSRRFILAKDRVGFSLHDTVIDAGTETYMWYKHHIEAVYCIRGHGTLEDVATGEIHEVGPGTMYLLDQHDKHILRAETEMQMVCVFNPPCTGREVHDEEGVYPLLTEDDAEAEDSAPMAGASPA
jgi:L-ectoine synthase